MRYFVRWLKRLLPVLVCMCCMTACADTAQTPLTIDFYKIGKADAALILGVGEDGNPFSVLIDTGEADDAPEIIEKVKAVGVETLDCLILSHFDKDHIGGVPAILAEVPAKTVFLPDYVGEGEPYDAMCAALKDHPDVRVLTEDTMLAFAEVRFRLSPPKAAVYEKKQDNNSSLCVTMTCGAHTVLFAGDAEEARQAELLTEGLSGLTLLKVPHHGAYNDNIELFFAACNAAFAVITDSDKNPADRAVLDALTAGGTRIYETRNGDIRVTLTEDRILVSQ